MKRRTHIEHLENMSKECGSVHDNLHAAILHGRPNEAINTIARALSSARSVNRTMQITQKKANQILNTALWIVGMRDYVGVWKAELYGPDQLATWAMPVNGAKVRFRLLTHGKKYKGDIKKCPLFKVMNLEFPVRWLDLSPIALRNEMIKRS